MENESTIPVIAPAWGEEVLSQLSWFKLDRLKQANVMVVGCGALGNEVLKNLVLFGVGHLVIVDFDIVESTNLTRSVLFRRSTLLSIFCRCRAIFVTISGWDCCAKWMWSLGASITVGLAIA